MTFRLEIEADSYGELVQKVIQHLHLPIDVGTHIEVREKIASALATGVEEARQIEAGEAPPISSAQGFDVVAGRGGAETQAPHQSGDGSRARGGSGSCRSSR